MRVQMTVNIKDRNGSSRRHRAVLDEEPMSKVAAWKTNVFNILRAGGPAAPTLPRDDEQIFSPPVSLSLCLSRSAFTRLPCLSFFLSLSTTDKKKKKNDDDNLTSSSIYT